MDSAPAPRRLSERLPALVAGLVAVSALAVSAHTAWLQRTQVRAQVWPRVELSVTPLPGDLRYRVSNVGVGPARLRQVVVTVDGKPMEGWAQVRAALLPVPPPPPPPPVPAAAGGAVPPQRPGACTMSTFHGRVIGAGTGFDVLACSGPFADALGKELQKGRVGVELCYCSVLDECWLLGGPDDRDEQVDVCPVRSVPFGG